MDIEQLVCRMARENEWGYKRIQGELKKLDIIISKRTDEIMGVVHQWPDGVSSFEVKSGC